MFFDAWSIVDNMNRLRRIIHFGDLAFEDQITKFLAETDDFKTLRDLMQHPDKDYKKNDAQIASSRILGSIFWTDYRLYDSTLADTKLAVCQIHAGSHATSERESNFQQNVDRFPGAEAGNFVLRAYGTSVDLSRAHASANEAVSRISDALEKAWAEFLERREKGGRPVPPEACVRTEADSAASHLMNIHLEGVEQGHGMEPDAQRANVVPQAEIPNVYSQIMEALKVRVGAYNRIFAILSVEADVRMTAIWLEGLYFQLKEICELMSRAALVAFNEYPPFRESRFTSSRNASDIWEMLSDGHANCFPLAMRLKIVNDGNSGEIFEEGHLKLDEFVTIYRTVTDRLQAKSLDSLFRSGQQTYSTTEANDWLGKILELLQEHGLSLPHRSRIMYSQLAVKPDARSISSIWKVTEEVDRQFTMNTIVTPKSNLTIQESPLAQNVRASLWPIVERPEVRFRRAFGWLGKLVARANKIIFREGV